MNRPHANTDKPRLLVTTTTLPRSELDPEPRFVIDLARNMAKQFQTTVLAPSFPGANPREILFGVEVIRYRYAPLQRWERLACPGSIMSRLRTEKKQFLHVPGLVLGQTLALRRLLSQRRFDLIHAHWTIPQGLLAAILPGRLRVPFVTTAHGGDVYTLGAGVLRPLLRLTLRRASAVTAVSGDLVRTLAAETGVSDLDRKLHCIPMGVDGPAFARAALVSERPADIPSGVPVILFVGRLAPKKGVEILIKAIASLPSTFDNAKVVIIGEGPSRADLVALSVALGVEHRFSFLGARTHAQLPAYLSSSDIFVLPSIHAACGDKDGLPVTLLEAAACGLPAIASDIAGVPEFIQDGKNGLLVPPGDPHALAGALEKMLSSADLRKQCAAAAKITVQDFDWHKIAARYASVFQEVLASAKPGSRNDLSSVPHPDRCQFKSDTSGN